MQNSIDNVISFGFSNHNFVCFVFGLAFSGRNNYSIFILNKGLQEAVKKKETIAFSK